MSSRSVPTAASRAAALLSGALRAVGLPVNILHECTHVLVATPWAEEWEIVIGPRDAELSMHTVVDYRDDAPVWAIAASHVAPFVTGLLGALVAGLLMLTGGVSAGSVSGWDLLMWSALAMAWAMYTRPSGGDLEGAKLALQEADDDGEW